MAAALSVPLALENPVVVRREGPLHVLDFMGRLHARTGCPLVLDVGHLVAAQLASGLPLETGLDGFPFEAVIEVHVAGAVISRTSEGRGVYMDDHGQPLRSEVLGLLAEVLPAVPDAPGAGVRGRRTSGGGRPAHARRRSGRCSSRSRRARSAVAGAAAPRGPGAARCRPTPRTRPGGASTWCTGARRPTEDAPGVRGRSRGSGSR